MKELKISELMDDYIDNELDIEGESSVNNEELKELVMKQAKVKRKMKPLFKVLIAAAAAVCVMGAALPGVYITMTDGTQAHFYLDEHGRGHSSLGSIDRIDGIDDIILRENGRLYFTAYGGKTDITDLIDEDTPFIFMLHDLPTDKDNAENYIIVGGTPESYGYVSFVCLGGEWGSSGAYRTSSDDNDFHATGWYRNGVKQLQSEGRLENFHPGF